MYRDEETDSERKYPPEEAWLPSEEPAPSEYDQVSRPVRSGARPVGPGRMKPLSQPQPLPVSSGTRRIPSYPAWEKPPSAWAYPRLRGQEVHRPLRPLFFVAAGVALIAGLILAYSALTGHFGGVARASASPSPTASESSSAFGSPSVSASRSIAPSPSSTPGTPAPQISFRQYKVLPGDTVSKVAGKFGLKSWELLLANPKVTAPNYILKVGTYINIPQPGQLTPPPPGGPTPTPTPTPTPVAP